MNDINILTFWGVPNYGTFAQAYALQASIQKAYPEYDVKQINYLCQKHYKQYYSKYPIDPIWKKNFYKSLGKYLNPFSDYHKRRKNFPRDYNIIPHTEQFTASQLSLYEMDCLVLGSDIIWDYSFAFFDNDPYLFGNGLKAKKKVAYACSFGTVSNHNKHPEYVIDGIKDLNYISVRDENSADIVEEITGVRPPVVLDPTWLWDFSNDNNIIKPKFDNYIIVYTQYRGIDKEAPSFFRADDVTILPTKKDPDLFWGRGGAITNEGKFIEASRVGDAFGGYYDFEKEKVPFYRETVIYIPVIPNHWGHFLLDCLCRFWFINDDKYKAVSYTHLTLPTNSLV